MFPAEVKPHDALPPSLCSHAIYRCPLHGLVSATLSHFCVSIAPQHTKAGMCLGKEMCGLDQLRSVRSYSAVGVEFDVNESTVYI